jgi:hypothetical protein
MMQIVSAKRYGFRTVIVVCHNPGEPEYIHDDGSVHPSANTDGCYADDPAYQVCHGNRRLDEIILDGPDQYRDGVLLTDDEIWAEVCKRCGPASDPTVIDGLIGRTN